MNGIDFTWAFLRMMAALVVVCIAAILVLRYWVPRLSLRGRGPKQSPFELLARFGLEHKRALYLMKIAGKNYVLGASEGGIHKITELTEEEMRDVGKS